MLKETDLVSFFDESTMSNLVDPCREIFLETSKILINQDYLKNTMYLSSFSINCNKTHYRKRLNDLFDPAAYPARSGRVWVCEEKG